MYELHIDEGLNQLHVTLSETFDERQAESLIVELEQGIQGLSKGFLVLCNVSSLEKFDCSARLHYRKFMDLCREAGVGKVVHIVPDIHTNFGLTVMSYFHYAGVPVITCRNHEEATRHLHMA